MKVYFRDKDNFPPVIIDGAGVAGAHPSRINETGVRVIGIVTGAYPVHGFRFKPDAVIPLATVREHIGSSSLREILANRTAVRLALENPIGQGKTHINCFAPSIKDITDETE